jgi:hypothetical protein
VATQSTDCAMRKNTNALVDRKILTADIRQRGATRLMDWLQAESAVPRTLDEFAAVSDRYSSAPSAATDGGIPRVSQTNRTAGSGHVDSRTDDEKDAEEQR